jgi:hypothetical protein
MQGLALGAQAAKIADLEAQLEAERNARRALEREHRERLDALSGSLAKAWKLLDGLAPLRFQAVAPLLVGAPLPAPEPRLPVERVSISEAARRLDVNGETVRRLVESGVLEGEAQEIPGRRYRKWSIAARSLDALAADAELRNSTGARTG